MRVCERAFVVCLVTILFTFTFAANSRAHASVVVRLSRSLPK